MTYQVLLTDAAQRDLHAAAAAIAVDAPLTAKRWLNGFVAALESLARDAEMYAGASEGLRLGIDVRQFIYRTKSRRANRALYVIRGSTVAVLAIRRPGQDLLSPEELERALSELR